MARRHRRVAITADATSPATRATILRLTASNPQSPPSNPPVHNLRDAWRALRRTPLVSIVAILSLALGIGANTAMFSILDTLILRTLPVPHAGRLALLTNEGRPASLTNPIWEEIRAREEAFDGAFAWSMQRFNLATGGEAELVDGMYASGRIFDVLGVPAVVGRVFTPSDDRRGGGDAGLVAVISHDYWQRQYGGARDVIGRGLTLEGRTFTIVGVTPPGFFGPEVGRRFDVAIPLGTERAIRGNESALDQRSWWWLQAMVRLGPGQSLAAANAALRQMQPHVREATIPPHYRPENVERYLRDPYTLMEASTGTSRLRDQYQRPLLTIMAVVGLVLLIACGNVANLLLARATARRHELSVRQALGASRAQLARQLFAESALLSASGAILGILFAVWGSRLLVRQLALRGTPAALDLSLDWRVFAFTAAVAVGTALLFGTAPALRAARARPMEAMREQGRGNSGDARAGLGGSLVVMQVALSLVLVVGAALFLRTFATLTSMRLGFDRDRVLVVRVDATRSAVDTLARVALYERLQRAALGVPGVSQAALSVVTPVSGTTWNNLVEVDGMPPRSEEERSTNVNVLTPGWFATYGTPLLAGRDIDARDREGAPMVAVVNETFVRKHLGGGNPIGRIIRQPGFMGEPGRTIEIVGLARDAVYGGLRDTLPPTMYLPLAQNGRTPSSISLSVRGERGAPATLGRAIVAALAQVDPALSLRVTPLEQQVQGSLTQERLVAMLSAFFGALALLLAGVGLYGVTAYAVTRRRAELGIRMALGSAPAGIMRLVMARVAALVVAGVVLGSLASWWLSRFVGGLLYGLTPRDPFSFGAGALALVLVGLLAGWVPARRAARLDPATVLREE